MSSWKRAILAHTGVNLLGLGLTTLFQALLGWLLVRDLGLAGYGAYALLAAFVLHFLLFAEPLGAWVTRETARGGPDLGRRLDAALGLWWSLSLPLLLVVLGLSALALQRHDPGARLPVLLLGPPAFLLAQTGSFLQAILAGRERFAALRAVQAGGPLGRLAGVAAVHFLLPPSTWLPAYAAVFTLGVAGQTAALLVLVRRALGRLPRPAAAPRLWGRITAFAGPLLAIKLAALAARRLDLWLVALCLTPAAVGLYGIALLVQGLSEQVLEAVRACVLPVGTRLRTAGGGWRSREFLLRATALSAFLTLAFATVLLPHLPELLAAVFGPPARAAALPAALLLLAQVLVAFRAVGYGLAVAAGATGTLVVPFAAAALLNVAVSLAGTLLLGLPGPALGTLLGGLLLVRWQGRRILRVLGVGPRAFRAVLTRSLLAWGGAWLPAALTRPFLPAGAATLLYLLLHGALYFYLCLTPADRTFLRRLFGRRLEGLT